MFGFLQDGLFSRLFPSGIPAEGAWKYYLAYFGFAVLVILSAYLFGSVNASIVVSKTIYGDDIRNHGSGNAGLTNMLRTYGKGAAGLTLLGDLLKTALAVLVAGIFFGFGYVGGISVGGGIVGPEMGFCYIAGLFAVIGHVFPIFYKFKGGKGVLATATMALILSPLPFAFLLLLFIIIVAISKYVSLGSVVVAIFYPVSLFVYFKIFFGGEPMPLLMAFASIAIAILIVWCHRENLERISNQTERKLSFKKKPEVTKTENDEENNEV